MCPGQHRAGGPEQPVATVGAEVFRLVDVVAAVPFVIVREAVKVNGVIVVEFLSGGLDVVLLLVVLTAVSKIVLLSAVVKTL